GFIAIVETDIDRVRLAAWNRINCRANALGVSQISCGGDVFTGGWLIRGINCVQVVVFVTGLILNEQNEFCVTAPEILGDGPALVSSDWFGCIERLLDRKSTRLN